jgi:CHAT domain
MMESSLSMTLVEDNSDGFRRPEGYDQIWALDREGAINIQPSDEEFEIVLTDKKFRDGEPAIINLNEIALFDAVQTCRSAWDQALEALTTMRANPIGGAEKPFRPYEHAWDKPVSDDSFHELGAKLAVAGNDLFTCVFERNQGTPLDKVAARLRNIARSGECILTVKTAHFHIPWRMLYTHPAGELAADGNNFKPSGFWGYRHVIEQYPSIYPINDHLKARDHKVGFGAALHDRIDTEFKVDCLKRHRDFIQSSADVLTYTEWTKITGLESGLSAVPFQQQVLYFLCHAEVAGSTAAPSLVPATLQLSDGKIDVGRVRVLVKKKFEPSPPLIFVNACRGGQLGTLVRQNLAFASQFLEQGAICVVGPQIEVPAVFAGEFGNRFFTALMQRTNPSPRAGLVLRELTREMWMHNNPFGLVYSLYAGADCHIRWGEEDAA